jgi:hypothetical protein
MMVDVKEEVEVEDVIFIACRLPGFKPTATPTSSVAAKKKGTHPSSATGSSSSMLAVRLAVVKLQEARRRRVEKEPTLVVQEENAMVGKCRHCFDATGKTCIHWMHTGLKCSSKPGAVSSNHGLLRVLISILARRMLVFWSVIMICLAVNMHVTASGGYDRGYYACVHSAVFALLLVI